MFSVITFQPAVDLLWTAWDSFTTGNLTSISYDLGTIFVAP
jgi:hypothetical protein